MISVQDDHGGSLWIIFDYNSPTARVTICQLTNFRTVAINHELLCVIFEGNKSMSLSLADDGLRGIIDQLR